MFTNYSRVGLSQTVQASAADDWMVELKGQFDTVVKATPSLPAPPFDKFVEKFEEGMKAFTLQTVKYLMSSGIANVTLEINQILIGRLSVSSGEVLAKEKKFVGNDVKQTAIQVRVADVKVVVPQSQLRNQEGLERFVTEINDSGSYCLNLSGSTATISVVCKKGSWENFDPVIDVQTAKPDVAKVEQVTLDLSAALRIAQHATDCTSNFTMRGSLYGVQIGTVMEVTFAVPNIKEPTTDPREVAPKAEESNQSILMQVSEDEGFDVNPAGQYVAASLCSKALVDLQLTLDELFLREAKGSRGVLLVYDPVAASGFNTMNIAAYTLTTEYSNYKVEMSTKKTSNLRHDELRELETKTLIACKVHEAGVLRPLQLNIRCNALQKMLMHTVEVKPHIASSQLATNTIATQYLEELLSSTVNNCEQLRRATTNADKVHQILVLEQLKRQTKQLVGLCDSALVNTALATSL